MINKLYTCQGPRLIVNSWHYGKLPLWGNFDVIVHCGCLFTLHLNSSDTRQTQCSTSCIQQTLLRAALRLGESRGVEVILLPLRGLFLPRLVQGGRFISMTAFTTKAFVQPFLSNL